SQHLAEGGRSVSDSLFPGLDDLPPDRARQFEDVCDRFEAAWKTGAAPCIADFLEGWTEPARSLLLRELVLLDDECRRQRGQTSDELYRDLVGFDPRWLRPGLAVNGQAGE